MAALAAVAVLVVAMVISGGGGVAAAVTSKKPVIYIFGDSMSDVGNNNYLILSLAKSDYPWYGVDYETGFPTGRFTNGRTIGDIMGKQVTDRKSFGFLSARTARYVMFLCVRACSRQVWRPAAAAVPVVVHDRRRGARRRQLRVRRRRPPQRDRHLLRKPRATCSSSLQQKITSTLHDCSSCHECGWPCCFCRFSTCRSTTRYRRSRRSRTP